MVVVSSSHSYTSSCSPHSFLDDRLITNTGGAQNIGKKSKDKAEKAEKKDKASKSGGFRGLKGIM
jgi:hypothetical protein